MPDPELVVLLVKEDNFVSSAPKSHLHIPDAPFRCALSKNHSKRDQRALPKRRYQLIDGAHLNIQIQPAVDTNAKTQWRKSDR